MAVRLQINVSDKVAKQIDEYANEIGISRNAMCAVLLHNGVENKLFGNDASLLKEVSETAKEDASLYNVNGGAGMKGG